MTVLCVPPLEEEPWPTLGPGVCDWMESTLPHGPGDLLGMPITLNDLDRALIYRTYEIYPRGHSQAGRRRFNTVGISMRKGRSKTEKGALFTAAELHPEAPVRFAAWGVRGDPTQPEGRGVTDPYIPLVAVTEEQSEDLVFGALFQILSRSRVSSDFDIGLERIMRRNGDGKAEALSAAPDARDGGRTTFQVFEETHRWVAQRLKRAHTTMRQNAAKRLAADPWSLEVTTAFEPGAGSVAEGTYEYAQAIDAGKIKDPRLFYYHCQASESHNLKTERGARAALREASQSDWGWTNVEAIMAEWADPRTDPSYWARVWGNIPTQGSLQAFDMTRWKELASPGKKLEKGEVVTLGFDGSRYNDATALVAEGVLSGHIQSLGCWERPYNAGEDWEVPAHEVDAVVKEAFSQFSVWRMYCDPPLWESWIAGWAGLYGEKTVVAWPTNRLSPAAKMIRAFDNAIRAGEISHDGNETLTQHLGNARRKYLHFNDDEGKPLWVIQKDRPDSPRKIDAGMAAALAHEARTDAVAAGAGKVPESVYEGRGMRFL